MGENSDTELLEEDRTDNEALPVVLVENSDVE